MRGGRGRFGTRWPFSHVTFISLYGALIMKVLVACEFSGIVREAFRARGHDAWSCDLEESEVEGPHYKCDVIEVLGLGWDLMIAHPPCTYLTNAGVHYLHPHADWKVPRVVGGVRMFAMREAAQFFRTLQNAPIERVCVENPIPHRYAREIIGQYDQIIQPWMFGDNEVKTTCLWLKELPKLRDTSVTLGNTHRHEVVRWHKNRAKERSRFFPGIAAAMADQWGRLGSRQPP
jgi:hypothetical protein